VNGRYTVAVVAPAPAAAVDAIPITKAVAKHATLR
jgi:hypothetical protein